MADKKFNVSIIASIDDAGRESCELIKSMMQQNKPLIIIMRADMSTKALKRRFDLVDAVRHTSELSKWDGKKLLLLNPECANKIPTICTKANVVFSYPCWDSTIRILDEAFNPVVEPPKPFVVYKPASIQESARELLKQLADATVADVLTVIKDTYILLDAPVKIEINGQLINASQVSIRDGMLIIK